jgi:hypothetical protein
MTILVISKSEIQKTLNTLVKSSMVNTKLASAQLTQLNNVSREFRTLLNDFAGKRTILLYSWLRRMLELLHASNKKQEIEIVTITKSNLDNFVLPADKILSLTISLNDFGPGDLKFLLNKISMLAIHNIFLQGGNHFAPQEIADFLEQLYNVELINVEEDSHELVVKFANKYTHRNALIKQFGLKNQPDIWKAITEKWLNLRSIGDEIAYIKPLDTDVSEYNSYLRQVANEEKKSESSASEAAAINFEFYTLVNACVNVVGDTFFEKVLACLNDETRFETSSTTRSLILNKELNTNKLARLASYLQHQAGKLVFSQLSLLVRKNLVASKEFTAVIMALKNSGIKSLELMLPSFLSPTESTEIKATLTKLLPGNVDYLVVITQQGDNKYPSEFANLQEILIETVQQKNLRILFHEHTATTATISKERIADVPESVAEGTLAKKIRLKELMKQGPVSNELDAEIDQHIKVEVQHNVVAEQVEEVQELATNTVEVDQSATYPLYEGKLVGYKDFCLGSPYVDIVLSNQAKPLVESKSETESESASPDPFSLVSQEFFVNVPHNTKYFSHEAALEMARNLAALSTFNVTNPPLIFHPRKTNLGEVILIYDPDAPAREPNVFTPKLLSVYEKRAPIYPVDLAAEDVKKWIDSDKLFNAICMKSVSSSSVQFDASKLVNLWIMYRDRGTQYFFHTIKSLDKNHADFSLFIFNSYLSHFMHWDHLLEDESFFESLLSINDYNEVKMTCLKKFLVDTGSSKHKFSDTIVAFEFFWSQVNRLCEQRNADINNINADWSTPKGGNPIVYMERLLEILAKSRNLAEQLECLSGLVLNNYGPYYAVKHEGFKLVSKEMKFKVGYFDLDKLPFNPDLQLYRITLDEIYNGVKTSGYIYFRAAAASLSDEEYKQKYHSSKKMDEDDKVRERSWLIKDAGDELSNDEFLSLVRKSWVLQGATDNLSKDEFIKLVDAGNATPGETRQVLTYDVEQFLPPYKLYFQGADGTCIMELDEYKHNYSKKMIKTAAFRFMGLQAGGVNFKKYVTALEKFDGPYRPGMTKIIFASLFFVTHSRYQGVVALELLFKEIDGQVCHEEVITTMNRYLMDFYKRDIKLSDSEGLVICERIARMNSNEFECWEFGRDKAKYIRKLFKHLLKNKYGVLKALQFIYAHGYNKWPFVFSLDTTEYLEQDPNIAHAYKEDLLLFGTQINSISKNCYYVDRRDKFKATTAENVAAVKQYLITAATTPKPNNLDYAFQAIIASGRYFDYKIFLSLCKIVSELTDFSPSVIDNILRKHNFERENVEVMRFSRSSEDLRNIMVKFGYILHKIKAYDGAPQNLVNLIADSNASASLDFAKLSFLDLQRELQKLWNENSSKFSIVANHPIIKSLFLQLRNCIIDTQISEGEKFAVLGENAVTEKTIFPFIRAKIGKLQDFDDCYDFEKIARITSNLETINNLLLTIAARQNYDSDEKAIVSSFKKLDFKLLDYEMLFAMLTMIHQIPKRSYTGILKQLLAAKDIISNKHKFLELVGYVDKLAAASLPTTMIEKIISFAIAQANNTTVSGLIIEFIKLYKLNSDDVLLNFVIDNLNIGAENARTILNYRLATVDNAHPAICELLNSLVAADSAKIMNFLTTLNKKGNEKNRAKVLEIVGVSSISGRVKSKANKKIDYLELVLALHDLSDEFLDQLYEFFQNSFLSGFCLLGALQSRDVTKPFDQFLADLEKSPFGPRDLAKQFSTAELERVVNNLTDLQNNSLHTNQYRKQIMEAALFVNSCGLDLPIYNNKPAKDLSNYEIKLCFGKIKANFSDQTQAILSALPLMREAMYRATGEFPYIDTQIIALLDSVMQKGDVIENIDTSQGKSLIDTMKGALLWLMSDCVDITTSSLVDAKLQAESYGPLLTILGIPHSAKLITASSAFSDYKIDGVNFSTFSALSIFLSRARAEGFVIKTPRNKRSLVANESDHGILDDRTIYRYAVTGANGIGYGDEWIYYAINEFVSHPIFISEDSTALTDVRALRKFLMRKTQQQNKSPKIISKFDDAQLLAWIVSSIIAQRCLRENYSYVIPEKPVTKIINGLTCVTDAVKILQKDGKVNPETTFGNGIQQFLYAYLNKKEEHLPAEKCRNFVIEVESQTIVSTNNRNLIEYYQSGEGLIWGSSGTVGSTAEMMEQHSKYGFKFSGIPPHQKNIVKIHKPQLFADEATQFAAIVKQSLTLRASNKNHISLIFCKDIPTAIRLHAQYEKKAVKQLQLYIGIGNEEEAIVNAANPGITITTSVLGRNTNILYDRTVGMTVFNTYPDAVRGVGQKAGRTGREGSPGTVYNYFNKLELNNRTIEEITAELDAKAAEERKFNEDLYSVLGYLLTAIDTLASNDFCNGKKDEFLRKVWAKFTDDVELTYREAKINNNYTAELFVYETVRLFNQELANALQPGSVIALDPNNVLVAVTKKADLPATVGIDPTPVKIADCIAPEFIAYGMMSYGAKMEKSSITKEEVKAKLSKLFDSIARNQQSADNKDYIAYLNANQGAIALIRVAHAEFLDEFLKKKIEESNTTWFVRRCFGYVGALNNIASNQHYLLMFKAMTEVNDRRPVIRLPDLKEVIINLLDQYLQNSWFVNASRKQAVADLQKVINNASSIDKLLMILSEAQANIIASDIVANKNSLWRFFKPLNYFGNSRLQNTMSDMVGLMSTLTGDNINLTVATELTKQLATVISHTSTALATDVPTLDNLHAVVTKARFKDSSNAKVLIDNAKKLLRNDLLFVNPIKMTGRSAFFQYEVKAEKVAASHSSSQPNPKI